MFSIQRVDNIYCLAYVLPFVLTIRVKDTCLPELALQINNTFSNPWGTSDQLFRDVFVYFEELEGIRKELKQGVLNGLDPAKDLPDQFRKYQEVKDAGGPIHVQPGLDIKPLVAYYNWNAEHISEFYELIQFTKEAWEKIQHLFQEEEERPPLTFKEKLKLNIYKDKS